MKTKRLAARKKRINIIFTAGIALMLAFILISVWEFSYRNAKQAQKLSETHLCELALQTAYAIKSKMEDSMSIVKITAETVSQFEDLHSEESLEQLDRISRESNFERMRITTPDGKSCLSKTDAIQISGRDYFKSAMWGSCGISQVMPSLYNEEKILVFYAPIKKDDKIIGMVHGVQAVNDLSEEVEEAKFAGNGYVYIVEKDGTIVLSVDKAEKMKTQINVWEFFRTTEFKKNYDFQTLYEDVQAGESGVVSYDDFGEERIAYYTPVGINDWYIMQIMPKQIILDQLQPVNDIVFVLVAKIILIFFLMAIMTVVLGQRAWSALKLSNERFKIAVSHTLNKIFEFDPTSQKVELSEEIMQEYNFPKVIENVTDYIKNGPIKNKTYADDLLLAFQKIMAGEKEATCIIEVEKDKHNGKWEKVTLTNVFDRGRPIRAIGTVEDITIARKAELRYKKEQQYRAAMFSDALSIFEINLTKDEFVTEGENNKPSDDKYSQVHVSLAKNVVCEEDLDSFIKASDREYLLEAFRSGKEELKLEYRRLHTKGELYWVCSTTNLLRDPATGDIKAFVYVKDINDQKKRELELQYKADRNSLTGLYNRAATERLIGEFLQSNGRRGIHGFFILDLDNFKAINDTYGHMIGDEVLIKVAEQLTSIFRTTDIVSRMGGDEFTVFLKDVGSIERIKMKAAELCDRIQQIKIEGHDEPCIGTSVGISIAPVQGTSFKELYGKSDEALYIAKKNSKGTYKLYEEKAEA